MCKELVIEIALYRTAYWPVTLGDRMMAGRSQEQLLGSRMLNHVANTEVPGCMDGSTLRAQVAQQPSYQGLIDPDSTLQPVRKPFRYLKVV